MIGGPTGNGHKATVPFAHRCLPDPGIITLGLVPLLWVVTDVVVCRLDEAIGESISEVMPKGQVEGFQLLRVHRQRSFRSFAALCGTPRSQPRGLGQHAALRDGICAIRVAQNEQTASERRKNGLTK